MVCPPAWRAAIPVGARTTCRIFSFCRISLIKVVFPVPALPIIRSGLFFSESIASSILSGNLYNLFGAGNYEQNAVMDYTRFIPNGENFGISSTRIFTVASGIQGSPAQDNYVNCLHFFRSMSQVRYIPAGAAECLRRLPDCAIYLTSVSYKDREKP